jgi:hypothetical protein
VVSGVYCSVKGNSGRTVGGGGRILCGPTRGYTGSSGHGLRGNLKPGMTALSRTSSNSTDRKTRKLQSGVDSRQLSWLVVT